jgi:hypothetical protein
MDSLPPTSPPRIVATAITAGPRFFAKLVDLAIAFVFGCLVLYSASQQIGSIFILLGWLLYNWIMIATRGATLGKMMIGAVVVTSIDAPCGWGRSFARAILEFFYIVPLVWLLSVILFLLDKEDRTPLDHTAGTRVVDRHEIPQLSERATFRITQSIGLRLIVCLLLSLATSYGWLTEGAELKWDAVARGFLAGVAWSSLLLFLLPFLSRVIWRFLLDRITEISRAVRGDS